MGQVCTGLCSRFKPTGFRNNLRYKIGQKWCSLCALFFMTQQNTCPCCKTRLRSSPRSKKDEMQRM
ncbi:MAG: hypothetical protein OEW86_03875 [Nitrosopumilus sp.]|nr:hypothetical protein [Nitrosopumilus sp.]MDH3516751.1 hypothetical protein [Nitrosopumilus sp.]MDH5417113.1 hypothetical protein [Nitrosopumilus sp.]MDH5554120.1 hypothetical protein [Nitrosopumilus sp.]